jgi:hypothetical protein
METQRRRITTGIVAILAATVVACGSIQAASGKGEMQPGGGSNYLSADQSYGLGLAPSADYPGQEQDVPEFLQRQRIGQASGASPAHAETSGQSLHP